jgi:primosomal protein N' (replication factor Y)
MWLATVIIEYQALNLDQVFDYFFVPEQNIQKGIRVYVPFRNKRIIGFVLEVKEIQQNAVEYMDEKGFTIFQVEAAIDSEPIINDELFLLTEKMHNFYLVPQVMCLNTILPNTLQPRSISKRAKPLIQKYVRLNDYYAGVLTPKQSALIEYLNNKDEKGDFLSNLKEYSTVVDTLIKNNVLVVEDRRKFRQVGSLNPTNNVLDKLSEEQLVAFNKIIDSPHKTFLLQGVTGSGKTEVYFSLIEHYLKLGKNVLFLVSEISLTSQIVSRFQAVFDYETAILHSGLSESEKYDEYSRISQNLVRVVIGARSAVFAPLKNIGIIIIDEEHSDTYKQEHNPFYNAKQIANFRQDICDCKIILGSATPSLFTKSLVLKDRIGFAQLKERYNSVSLPTVKVVNMLNELRNGNSTLFSSELALQLNIMKQNNAQGVILLNQRGYARKVYCSSCGQHIICPTCKIDMVFHAKDNTLKCHYCNLTIPYPNNCPTCNSEYLRKVGIGLEKVEEQFRLKFPHISIVRMDQDTTKKKHAQVTILEEFRDKKYDILLGTSMISKGLDFENVTLACMLNADIGLMSSFRSSETTFQLITQLIGRAGRGKQKGIGVVQTLNPEHYAILSAAKQNYSLFFQAEMERRKIASYPPYFYLVAIVLKHVEANYLKTVAYEIKDLINSYDLPTLVVLGPTSPYVEWFEGNYRQRIILKTKHLEELLNRLKLIKTYIKGLKNVNIDIDIDPLDD